MRRMTAAGLLLLVAAAMAQTYKCERCVIGIGGGDMAGAYRSSATIGQTAIGQITGTSFWALVGFWQPEEPTGVREQTQLPAPGTLVTRLRSPFPNPTARSVAIRYSLSNSGPVELRVHDLTGRAVRTLCASSMTRGEHGVKWDSRDDNGRTLANGVYFVRLVAGDYRSTEKLVLQK